MKGMHAFPFLCRFAVESIPFDPPPPGVRSVELLPDGLGVHLKLPQPLPVAPFGVVALQFDDLTPLGRVPIAAFYSQDEAVSFRVVVRAWLNFALYGEAVRA